MPTARELDPLAMTEEERLGKRRFEASFTFETTIPRWAAANARPKKKPNTTTSSNRRMNKIREHYGLNQHQFGVDESDSDGGDGDGA